MEPIGDRLGDVRRRHGYTQEQLAERAQISVSTIRKLERGERDNARLPTLHALARALGVQTSALFGPSAPPAPEPASERHELDLMRLRAALTPVPAALSPVTDAGDPDAEDVATRVRAAWQMFDANAYTAVAKELPDLLPRARQSGDTDTLLLALRLATHLLTIYNQTDLAYIPVTEGIELAESAGDSLMVGTLTNSFGWLLMRQGRLEETRRIATAMADRIEPKLSKASPAEVSVWGGLLLRASSAAVRDNRPTEADDMLSLASAASRRVSEGVSDGYWHWTFSPPIVAMKRVENAMVRGDAQKALTLTSRVPRRGHVPDGDLNRHRLDVANAHVARREYSTAFDVFRQIRRDAPEWLQHQHYARDVLSRALAKRVRPVSPELRELATFMRV